MKCLICNSENFVNIDRLRSKPQGMVLCNTCGFVAYDKWKDREDYLNHYRGDDYRKAPNFNSIITGLNKLHYHGKFLSPLYTEWKKEGKEPTVCDVGGAIGMFLKWSSDFFDGKGIFTGAELTKSHRLVAKYEYNIDLTEKIDSSKKYDLISYYKVLEHIPYAYDELMEAKELLNDNGYFYISNPIWFERISLFGVEGEATTFDRYFDPNHVNVWTEKHSINLLNKAGLEVTKVDYNMYDSTYLCKKGAVKDVQYEDPKDILDRLEKIKIAIEHYQNRNPEKAIEVWPNFPEAYFAKYEKNRSKFHEEGPDSIEQEILAPMKLACTNSATPYLLEADIAARYENFDKALTAIDKVLEMKPNDIRALRLLASIFTQKNDLVNAIKTWQLIRNICPAMISDATNMLFAIYSKGAL